MNLLLLKINTLLVLYFLGSYGYSQKKDRSGEVLLSIPNLICFWDFQKNPKGQVNLTSKGPYAYTLKEMNGPIALNAEGIFGPSSLEIVRGQWLRIKREDCPALNIHGKKEVSIVAWIKRKANVRWQYIAGVWDERHEKRQYALFTGGHMQTDYTTLTRTAAENQIHGYVSDVGGPTPDRPWAFSYATGKQKLEEDVWHMVAFTYDHKQIKVYADGELDTNGNYNPFLWDKPIFDGGDQGADFTVAQRDVHSWPSFPEGMPGNKVGFGGVLGGLAVYGRALTSQEIQKIHQSTRPGKNN
ncbi:LamG-like jellyroll fold domain-containing protein [Telluribacter sp.]|jgi:hypothetical protein|uniref:LamG-like jellyroll fold domain-containing protein n=1 Tax=Telluribacter sp. TaxID=1978767 RepID=UPI002E1623BC|nr:LamG-like jellyroll fold domain-containing protein [Telluribacter sp.]